MSMVLNNRYIEPIVDRVKGYILRNKLISDGDKVVVAVSGGPDSMAMFHILLELSSLLNIKLHLAHLDHQFRGVQSRKDAEFVRHHAEKLGQPITIESIDVPSIAWKNGLSDQVAAREIRYQFLFKVVKEVGGTKIALGHTSNDQAETVLERLLRGTGSRGLSGIPIFSRGIIIRPLLIISRDEIIEYLIRTKILFLNDPSNEKPIYLRNRIRHELLPFLAERYNPRIYAILNRETEILSRENEFLCQYSSNIMDDITSEKKEKRLELDLGLFSRLHTAIKRRVILEAVSRIKGDIYNINYAQIEGALRMLDIGRTGGIIILPGQVYIRKGYDRIIVTGLMDLEETEWSLAIPIPGRVFLPLLSIDIETSIIKGPYIYKGREDIGASFDHEGFSMPLIVRNRRMGDIIYPLGMSGKKKKLHDIFIDMKVPSEERGRIPLLVSPEGILWIIGIRQDDRFKVKEDTKRTLLVKIHKEGDRDG